MTNTDKKEEASLVLSEKKVNPIKFKDLYTLESDSDSYDFYGDNNGLSEDGKGDPIFAKDYEVFEIIFL